MDQVHTDFPFNYNSIENNFRAKIKIILVLRLYYNYNLTYLNFVSIASTKLTFILMLYNVDTCF